MRHVEGIVVGLAGRGFEVVQPPLHGPGGRQPLLGLQHAAHGQPRQDRDKPDDQAEQAEEGQESGTDRTQFEILM